MTIRIVQGNYTLDGVRGMMAKPSDRAEAVRPLVEAAGAKLLAFYVTYGETDFMAITEGGSDQAYMAAMMTAAASGTVSNLKTTVAVSSADLMAASEKAGALAAAFKPAGS